MAYHCPRCGGSVRRGKSQAAGMAGGLVGALLYAAFGAFQCKKCGTIATREFPPEVRQRMVIGSFGLIATAIIVLVLVVCLLIYLKG